MDRIQAMKVFLRVVEANSFVRAAESLSLPTSSVTESVKALEKHLKARLLNRTTRSLSLTPAGELYVLRCREILDLIETTENSLNQSAQKPEGRLRVDMPSGIAHSVILPNLKEFIDRFPGIYLNIGVNDRQVDLIQDGVDCVIRTGKLQNSTLVARRIKDFNWVTCGSPSYLERHGIPNVLEDLSTHNSVHYLSNTNRHGNEFLFLKNHEKVVVPMNGAMAVNETELYLKLCLEGYGLVQIAEILAIEHLRADRLVEVLSNFRPAPVPVSLVYPNQKLLSPATRAFADWAIELFSRSSLGL
ncbi:LysR family transcriptional regulator [Variovorax sp. H27-G14]|uniref:LysR family transcriptional regulator n=1 Tax=Variovorax sp. H27-G14 TaxID=3111914 RepID=UPI0038FD3268